MRPRLSLCHSFGAAQSCIHARVQRIKRCAANARGLVAARDRVERRKRSGVLRDALTARRRIAANAESSLLPTDHGEIAARRRLQKKQHLLARLESWHA